MTQPEPTTPPVPVKPIYMSKTVWAAVLTALVAIYEAIAPNYGWPTQFVAELKTVLIGLGLYGLRTANTTLGGTQTTPPTSPVAEQPNNVVPGPSGSGLEDLK